MLALPQSTRKVSICAASRPRRALQPAAQGDAAGWSARLGLDARQIDTLRVDCGNASVDYHRAGNVLLTLVDGSIVRLATR